MTTPLVIHPFTYVQVLVSTAYTINYYIPSARPTPGPSKAGRFYVLATR